MSVLALFRLKIISQMYGRTCLLISIIIVIQIFLVFNLSDVMSKFCIVADFYTCLYRSSVLYPKCRDVYGLSWYHCNMPLVTES